MATMGSGDDNEWQKLSPDQKVQHKVLHKSSLKLNLFNFF